MHHQGVVDRGDGEQTARSGVVGQFQRIGQIDAHDVVVDLRTDDELLGQRSSFDLDHKLGFSDHAQVDVSSRPTFGRSRL